MIHTGDCIEVMATMPADSVDAVVTDPPYGLEFMGRSWDRLGDVGTTSHSGPAAVAGGERGQYGKVTYSGSVNKKCRRCNKWQWDHEGRKCECKVPDFPNVGAHQGRLMQDWHYNWAVEALRVTKPGGYLLAFGGTRTHHRLVCGLEDAGWIIRDELDWIYASGFPKGKANLKPAHEPIVLARKPGPLRPLGIDECRIPGVVPQTVHGVSSRQGEVYGHFRDEPEPSIVNEGGRWPSNVLLSSPELFDEPNPYVVGSGAIQQSNAGTMKQDGVVGGFSGLSPRKAGTVLNHPDLVGGYSRFFAVPKRYNEQCARCGVDIAVPSSSNGTRATDDGTARPSADTPPLEPQPQDASAAVSPAASPGTATAPRRARTRRGGTTDSTGSADSVTPESGTTPTSSATEPAVSPDTTSPSDQPARTAGPPTTSTDTTPITRSRWMCGRCAADATSESIQPQPMESDDELPPDTLREPYPRYLILPKADRADREPVVRGQLTPQDVFRGNQPDNPRCLSCGLQRIGALGAEACICEDPEWAVIGDKQRENAHPTVKPTDLMRHLVRLVTPSGGTVLDPFLGSGSTAIACELEGFDWIGIEKEPEYVQIAEARLNGTQRGMGLDVELVGVPQPSRDGIAVQRNKTGEGYAATSYQIRQGSGPDMGYGRPKPPKAVIQTKHGMFDEDIPA